MESCLSDVRHSLRILRQSPSFTIAAVAALAVGIAANTAIFAVVNTVILRPLPFADSDRISTRGGPPSDTKPVYKSVTNKCSWEGKEVPGRAQFAASEWTEKRHVDVMWRF
jgi:hypothetical protein